MPNFFIQIVACFSTSVFFSFLFWCENLFVTKGIAACLCWTLMVELAAFFCGCFFHSLLLLWTYIFKQLMDGAFSFVIILSLFKGCFFVIRWYFANLFFVITCTFLFMIGYSFLWTALDVIHLLVRRESLSQSVPLAFVFDDLRRFGLLQSVVIAFMLSRISSLLLGVMLSWLFWNVCLCAFFLALWENWISFLLLGEQKKDRESRRMYGDDSSACQRKYSINI